MNNQVDNFKSCIQLFLIHGSTTSRPFPAGASNFELIFVGHAVFMNSPRFMLPRMVGKCKSLIALSVRTQIGVMRTKLLHSEVEVAKHDPDLHTFPQFVRRTNLPCLFFFCSALYYTILVHITGSHIVCWLLGMNAYLCPCALILTIQIRPRMSRNTENQSKSMSNPAWHSPPGEK